MENSSSALRDNNMSTNHRKRQGRGEHKHSNTSEEKKTFGSEMVKGWGGVGLWGPGSRGHRKGGGED